MTYTEQALPNSTTVWAEPRTIYSIHEVWTTEQRSPRRPPRCKPLCVELSELASYDVASVFDWSVPRGPVYPQDVGQ
jgi:hypothetical protein